MANKHFPKKSNKDEVEDTVRGIFGDAADSILEMLDGNDTDSATILTTKAMLASAISLLPTLEEAVKESPGSRTVYPFTTLVDQIRSLISDVQAQQDARLVADSICANQVHPCFLSLAQFTVDSIYRLRSGLRDHITKEDRKDVGRMIDETARSIAMYMEEQSRDLQTKITSRIVDL